MGDGVGDFVGVSVALLEESPAVVVAIVGVRVIGL